MWTIRSFGRVLATGLLAQSACDARPLPEPSSDVAVAEGAVTPAEERGAEADILGNGGGALLSPDELERGRLDPSWRRVAPGAGTSVDTSSNQEGWEEIGEDRVNRGPMHLPLRDGAGPSVLRVQVLLDRALFSPGILDGRWGKNTEKAVYWFQRREGLEATGEVDEETFKRLSEVAGVPDVLVRRQTLSEDDVAGPFVTIPEDIYEQAELSCMCYESLEEKLAERFHTSPEVLRQLNAEVTLSELKAGDRIAVPHVRDSTAGLGVQVARLQVSDAGYYLHALDAGGRILFHFPTTLGSSYDPSPTGDYRVVSITEEPWWHYQPEILAHVPSDRPDARIPPGPNNAVGMVWMALSVRHYGIHGTRAPETIGYATSAGCVRLTNWDALFLARRIEKGVPVEFRDASGR